MNAPKATLLLSTHCPHCQSLLDLLSQLLKAGELSHLHSINIDADPTIAKQYGVRSVPWVTIADHVLTGVQTMDALRQRIKWVNTQASLLGEFDHLLSNGQVMHVVKRIQYENTHFKIIMQLLTDPATILSTRIGIGVVMEEFAGTVLIQSHITELGQLLAHDDVRIRADAAHYLSLSDSKAAIPILQQHSDDSDAEVREVIADSLADLLTIH